MRASGVSTIDGVAMVQRSAAGKRPTEEDKKYPVLQYCRKECMRDWTMIPHSFEKGCCPHHG